jgi:uncharacterized protein YjdB
MATSSEQRQPIGGVPPYSYKATPSNIVVVDNTGLVAAVAAGTATITATDSAKPTPATASYQVNVSGRTAPLYIDPTTITLTVNESYTRTASNGTGTIRYASTSATVATVDAFGGQVRALRAGSASISANDDIASVSYQVIVTASALPLTMDTTTQNMDVNERYTRTASNGTGTIHYSSNTNATAVVGDLTGVVVALKAGTATVSARDDLTSVSYAVVVTASTLPLTIDTTTQTLKVNDTYTRTASNGTGAIHYSSSNPGFATVGDTNGTVRAVKAGPTSISARDDLTSVAYTVLVEANTPSLEMDESPYSLRADMIVIKEQLPINPPSSARYRRTATGSGTLKWTTSSNAVWINASTGDIVAWKNGTATVTVSDATGQSRSFQITVSGIRTIVGLNVKGTWAQTVSLAQAAGATVPTPGEIQAMRVIYNGAPPGEDNGQVWTNAMSGNRHVTNSLTSDAYATSPASGSNGSYGIKTLS